MKNCRMYLHSQQANQPVKGRMVIRRQAAISHASHASVCVSHHNVRPTAATVRPTAVDQSIAVVATRAVSVLRDSALH